MDILSTLFSRMQKTSVLIMIKGFDILNVTKFISFIYVYFFHILEKVKIRVEGCHRFQNLNQKDIEV